MFRRLLFLPKFHEKNSSGYWVLREDTKLFDPNTNKRFQFDYAMEEAREIVARGESLNTPYVIAYERLAKRLGIELSYLIYGLCLKDAGRFILIIYSQVISCRMRSENFCICS